MSETTPNKLRKLAAVVESWKLHPGPETLLQGQVAAALNEYAVVLEAGLSSAPDYEAAVMAYCGNDVMRAAGTGSFVRSIVDAAIGDRPSREAG